MFIKLSVSHQFFVYKVHIVRATFARILYVFVDGVFLQKVSRVTSICNTIR